jgi:two-component system, sensor histidine kinase and response regulator
MTRILIVEDEEMYCAILAETLSAEGFEVDSTGSGFEGVALAQRHVPDLILCDIMMGGMDGYAVLSALRRDPRTATIPVVFLTGLGERTHLRKGMDSGADDYLVKPVTRDDLLRAVNARLARHAEMRRHVHDRLAEARSDLAKSLPHEFLTPLTAVMSLSSLLAQDEPKDLDTVREMAQAIFVGSQALGIIAAKFLLYAELASEESLAVDPIAASDAAAVIREEAAAQAVRAERAGDLRLELEAAPAPLPKDHLRPLLDELVENAFTFSSPGTPVTVRCRQEGERWILTVLDEGRGFTPEQLAGLDAGRPFARRHDAQPGVGLGLAIVRRLVALYKGEIAFETGPNGGTAVSVRLPSPAGRPRPSAS